MAADTFYIGFVRRWRDLANWEPVTLKTTWAKAIDSVEKYCRDHNDSSGVVLPAGEKPIPTKKGKSDGECSGK